MVWSEVRLSNCTSAASILRPIAPSIDVAALVYLTFVLRRGRSHLVAPMAPISVDLRLEKDDWRRGKVRVRREGKIKVCGPTARDWSRFHCLHIGLSTAAAVPPLRNKARQLRIRAASICPFSQCHQGSFARFRFAVSLGA